MKEVDKDVYSHHQEGGMWLKLKFREMINLA